MRPGETHRPGSEASEGLSYPLPGPAPAVCGGYGTDLPTRSKCRRPGGFGPLTTASPLTQTAQALAAALIAPNTRRLSVEFVHEVGTGHARDAQDDPAGTGAVELPIARSDQGEVEDVGFGRVCLAGVTVRLMGEHGGELHRVRLLERW